MHYMEMEAVNGLIAIKYSTLLPNRLRHDSPGLIILLKKLPELMHLWQMRQS